MAALPDYFALYEIPQSFHPIKAEVRKKYYELSRLYHPDRVATADDASRMEALRMSAINNEAYHTLSDGDATIAYILKLHGLLENEEHYNLPPDFLMEMMELNEIIDDEGQDAQKALDEHLTAWNSGVAPLLEQFDKGNQSKEVLMQIKDYYFRKKYLLRIKHRMV
jgi:molecular chaperone HscB